MDTKQNVLTFKINTQEPIDIAALAESLKAIGELYSQSIGGNGIIKISEVRKGSYEFDFIATALPLFMEHTNTAMEFVKNLHFITDFFKKDRDTNLNKPTITQIENANKITQPIINIVGNNNTINFNSNNDNKQQSFVISQEEAKKFKEDSELYIQQQTIEQETENDEYTKTFSSEILEFTQTRDDSKKGTKAICKKFSRNEINIEFANNFIRDSIFKEEDNPHLFLFVVDLEVDFKDKKPKLYKIIAIKDKRIKPYDQRLPLE